MPIGSASGLCRAASDDERFLSKEDFKSYRTVSRSIFCHAHPCRSNAKPECLEKERPPSLQFSSRLCERPFFLRRSPTVLVCSSPSRNVRHGIVADVVQLQLEWYLKGERPMRSEVRLVSLCTVHTPWMHARTHLSGDAVQHALCHVTQLAIRSRIQPKRRHSSTWRSGSGMFVKRGRDGRE